MNEIAIYMATLADSVEKVIRSGVIRFSGGENTFQLDRNKPPAGHLPFIETRAIAIPAIGLGEITVLQIRVPDGYDGAIWELQTCLQASGVLTPGSGEIVWRIYADDTTIRNFSNITSEIGSITNGPDSVDGIRLKSSQVVKITIEHVANPLIEGNTIVSLKGYYYPSDTI